MGELQIIQRRLSKIGVDVEFASNYPWVYLYKINGLLVEETYKSEHGFTIAFSPIKSNQPYHFTDLSIVFEIIRKYCN